MSSPRILIRLRCVRPLVFLTVRTCPHGLSPKWRNSVPGRPWTFADVGLDDEGTSPTTERQSHFWSKQPIRSCRPLEVLNSCLRNGDRQGGGSRFCWLLGR